MLRLALIWIIMFAVVAGVGSLLQRVVLRRFDFDVFASFWTGLMTIIALLQFWNLALPINNAALIVVALAGIGGLALRWRDIKSCGFRLAHRLDDGRARRSMLMAVAFCLLIVLCAASRTTLSRIVPGSDTSGYHYNIVRWATDYPAVPGVANLHLRLGFNTSYLLVAALLEHFWGLGRSIVLMPGFLIAVVAAQWCLAIFAEQRRTHVARRYFALLTSPYLLKSIWALNPNLYYDTAPLLVCLVLAMEMVTWMCAQRDPEGNSASLAVHCGYWIGLAALGYTLKLSGAPQLAFVTLFSVLLLVRSTGRSMQSMSSVIRVGALPSLLVIGHLARNVILSGWLLFPIPALNLHLPWSPPESVVRELYETNVRDWARMPGEESAEVKKHPFWWWFGRWHKTFRKSTEKEALWIGIAAVAAWMMRRKRRDGVFDDGQPAWIARFVLFNLIAGVALWFIGAPDLRFGDGIIWCWMGAAVSFAATAWFRATRVAWLTCLVVAGYLTFSMQLDIVPLDSFNLWDIPRASAVPVKRVTIPNGQTPPLEIFMPEDEERGLGDSPLPASLYFNEDLMLREPGNLRRGFYLRQKSPSPHSPPDP